MAKWLVAPALPAEIDQELSDFSQLERQILFRQGVATKDQALNYLNPSYERDLTDPFLLIGMDRAVVRIWQAIKNNEKVCIFGDYDADGVPAAAVLADFFKLVNFSNFDVYIPDRHNEKYGLSEKVLTKLAEQGVSLIITVDCGITDVAEVAVANNLGLEIIITDHHLTPPILPRALAIIDPKQPGDIYPDKNLSGAGVAFKLVQALTQRSDLGGFLRSDLERKIKWLLDLVAIATVADMVPITGENRNLTYFGLKVLRQTPRVGLKVFLQANRLKSANISEDDISFVLGPRINTASRLSHGSQAYCLLTTNDPVEAEMIVAHLEEKNIDRREAVDDILLKINNLAIGPEQAVVVCGDPTWPLGVLGLTATRVVEKFNRPVFLWSQNGAGEIKGSCRSDGSVNVVDLMRLAGGDDLFLNFGGHAMAGGFSLPFGREEELVERLTTSLKQVARATLATELMADQVLTLGEVTLATYNQIERLGPYGVGNHKPRFWFNQLIIDQVKIFGSSRAHLELKFKDQGGRVVTAIGFFMAGTKVAEGQTIDLLANLELSHFRGRPELRLRIVDVNER